MITEVEKQDYGKEEKVNPEYHISRIGRKEKKKIIILEKQRLSSINRRIDVITEKRRRWSRE